MTRISNLLAFVLLFSLMQACISVSQISATSGLEEEYLRNIPQYARIVYVEKNNITPDDLYEEVYTILLLRGHRILKDDKARHYITTEGKDIGQSTLQRMTLVVIEEENGSKVKISTEWKGGTEANATATAISGMPVESDWGMARWESSRLGIAFAESVAIAKEIKNGEISFE